MKETIDLRGQAGVAMSDNMDYIPEELPQLAISPVCSLDQETVDTVMAHLWEHAPRRVNDVAEDEVTDGGHDSTFRDACYGVEEYLNRLPEGKLPLPRTHIAMTDIIHELSRRLRHAYGLAEIPVKGESIQNADGSLKPFQLVPKQDMVFYNYEFPVTQEMIDRVSLAAYQRDPDLMHAAAEQGRRHISTAGVANALTDLVRTITNEQGIIYHSGFKTSLVGGLSSTSGILSVAPAGQNLTEKTSKVSGNDFD